jgi:hypothetical protein
VAIKILIELPVQLNKFEGIGDGIKTTAICCFNCLMSNEKVIRGRPGVISGRCFRRPGFFRRHPRVTYLNKSSFLASLFRNLKYKASRNWVNIKA